MDRRRALRFVVALGLVSLFADVTYEGARSITGPYLGLLGASAAVVGLVAGAGELIGHTLRLASGYLADRTRRYWALTLIGYTVNLAAVPLLALTGRWQTAALLMILERTGKAVRTPARDAMLSHASAGLGRGWAFGLHEAMDQVGALTGPLVIALVLYLRGSMRFGFAVLAVPAVLALATLLFARRAYPNPQLFETSHPRTGAKALPRAFWLYLAAVGLVAAGYADFPLMAYHLKRTATAPDAAIPLFYAGAMAVDAVAALMLGRLFDRVGLAAVALGALLAAGAAPLVFLGGLKGAVAGMVLWGIGMGAQESIMRAAVAGMAPPERRGFVYGVFNTGYGLCWFAGSAVMGVLYGVSPVALVIFSAAAQLAAVPLLLTIKLER
jgi:MFS family permease